MLTENNHHEFYARRDMLSYRLSTQLRNHDRTQVLLPVEIHNDLHANVPKMDVPSASVARLALSHLNGLPRRYKSLDATRSLSDEFFDEPLGEHLALQLPFLILGSEALKRMHL
jgi:hypothetical protein